MKIFLLFLSTLAVTFPAYGQTWYSPTPQIIEGNTVTFTSPVTVRYGQNISTCAATYLTCVIGAASPAGWTAPIAINATTATPITIVVGVGWANSDPVPGVYKQIQIAQTSTTQAVAITNNSGGKITATIPAIGQLYTFNCPGTISATISSTGIVTLGSVALSGTCTAVKK